MREEFRRSELLLGPQALERLAGAHAAVFGVGGVGGHAAEALARAGVGSLTLFDSDTVALSNINRQIAATHATLGQYKVDVMAARIRDINPQARVTCMPVFYTVEDAPKYRLSEYDCIVDAIDTVSAKIELIARAAQAGVPIVSAMGCGNRLDATKFVVTDLYKTQNDPLARVLRRELRRRGVERLRVVCSTAPALTPRPGGETKGTAGRPAPGSVSWVPGVAGMICGRGGKDHRGHCRRIKRGGAAGAKGSGRAFLRVRPPLGNGAPCKARVNRPAPPARPAGGLQTLYKHDTFPWFYGGGRNCKIRVSRKRERKDLRTRQRSKKR